MKFREYLEKDGLLENISKRVPDSVGKFWVLDSLDPERFDKKITWDDVLFETDLSGFGLRVKGGLELSEIEGIFKSRNDAINFVKKNHPEAFGLLK